MIPLAFAIKTEALAILCAGILDFWLAEFGRESAPNSEFWRIGLHVTVGIIWKILISPRFSPASVSWALTTPWTLRTNTW